MAYKAAEIGFTAAEQKLLMSMIKHLKGGDFPTDWAAVATECEYKNAATAKNRWGNIKRAKNIGTGTSGDDGDNATPSKKRSAAGGDVGGSEPTPKSKRSRKGKTAEDAGGATALVKEEEVEEATSVGDELF